eukprot:2200646-Prymnesium_polylepis.1
MRRTTPSTLRTPRRGLRCHPSDGVGLCTFVAGLTAVCMLLGAGARKPASPTAQIASTIGLRVHGFK